jgi:hypothetical protein
MMATERLWSALDSGDVNFVTSLIQSNPKIIDSYNEVSSSFFIFLHKCSYMKSLTLNDRI